MRPQSGAIYLTSWLRYSQAGGAEGFARRYIEESQDPMLALHLVSALVVQGDNKGNTGLTLARWDLGMKGIEYTEVR